MATSRKASAKKPEPVEEAVQVEWFPAYGIKIDGRPYLAILGTTEFSAMSYLAAHLAEEGKRNNKIYLAKFKNDVFEIE